MLKYRYRPLDRELQEIRLVSLAPGSAEDPLRIAIHHAPFLPPSEFPPKRNATENLRQTVPYPWTVEETVDGDTLFLNKHTNETSWTHPHSASPLPGDQKPDFQPKYEALSYTWGPTEDSEIAYIEPEMQNCTAAAILNDRREGGECVTLELRQNLTLALRHLRYADKVRVMWIDALCINQEDISERNEQVKRMANIYRMAHRVVAWLGREEGGSKHAITTLQYIGRQIEETKSGRLFRAPRAEEPDMWMNACNLSYGDQTWQALSDLLECSWFYRLWCWQEIKLSSRQTILQFGRDQLSWTQFRRAVLCLHNKEILPSIMFRERCRHIACLRMDAESQSMSFLLDLSRSKGCTDAKDKIYGLLGITSPSFNASIVTDYSLSVEQVYKNAFLAHLRATRRLELLKHCDLAKRCIGGPSWVPDWSRTELAAPILSEQLSSGISQAHFRYIAPDVLEVVGIQYTTVQTVSVESSNCYEKALLVVPTWERELPRGDVYVTGQTMHEAFALTLCMNRTRERHPTNHFLDVTEWLVMLRAILSTDADVDGHDIYTHREIANVIQKVKGRTFITTGDGYMGMAPAGVRAGKLHLLYKGRPDSETYHYPR